MFMRTRRALLSVTALAALSFGGLHATAAMAAVPAGLGDEVSVVTVERVTVSAASVGSGRPVVEHPPVVFPPFVETGDDEDRGPLPPRTYDPEIGRFPPVCGIEPIVRPGGC